MAFSGGCSAWFRFLRVVEEMAGICVVVVADDFATFVLEKVEAKPLRR